MRQNPFAPRQRGGYQAYIRSIKTWTGAHVTLGPDDIISVSELACAEPDCPPYETIIVIVRVDGTAARMRVHKAMADVSESDVIEATPKLEPVARKRG